MGALASSNKRGNNDRSNYTIDLNFPFFHLTNYSNQIETHVKKKQKISSLMPQRNNSVASRLNQYPEPQNQIPREIHAPCRSHKLGLNVNFSGTNSRGYNDNIRVCENKLGFDCNFSRNCSSTGSKNNGNGVSENKGLFDISREVRAPRRGHEFEFDANLCSSSCNSRKNDYRVRENEGSVDKLGEALFLKLKRAGKCAVESLRLFRKNKEVVANAGGDFDEDGNSVKEVIDVDKEAVYDKVEFVDNGCENGAMDYKVKDASKVLDTLLLVSDDDDVLESPVHKKLLESAGRRNDRLGRLSLEIELNEKRLARFQLDQLVKKPDEKGVFEDLSWKAFVPLSDEEKDEVYQAFSSYNMRKVLVSDENSNIEITGEVLQCLRPGKWLNDEVINVYFELLKEREKKEPKKFLKCHFFNTFFYKKLISGKIGYDFKSVRRWTTLKKLGYTLSECDKIFVPIHKQSHWCLAVINNKDKKFQYLDSLRGSDIKALKVLAIYFADEVKDKNGVDIDVDSWTQEHVEDIPVQKNGSDCGMFMIKYADFYSRGLGLCFNQEHMPYFRLRTAKEILRLEAE